MEMYEHSNTSAEELENQELEQLCASAETSNMEIWEDVGGETPKDRNPTPFT